MSCYFRPFDVSNTDTCVHCCFLCAGVIDVNDHSLVNLLPSHQPGVVYFLSNSSAVRQKHALCGDIDACKYDLEKTKNLKLAAATKHFNIYASQTPRISLKDMVRPGKAIQLSNKQIGAS